MDKENKLLYVVLYEAFPKRSGLKMEYYSRVWFDKLTVTWESRAWTPEDILREK
jgi:hypothetical protein